MSKKDFYDVLGASRSASKDELKKAYRKLAMKYHPDRNPNDKNAEKKFKEVNEAYEILKDDQKRAAYDQMGHAAFDQMGGGGAQSSGGFGGHHGFGGSQFSDIFEEMFGGFGGARGGRRRAGANPGHDLQHTVTITLEEAFEGVHKKIRVTKHDRCEPCHGSGAKSGSSPVTCTTCQGQGVVHSQQGFFAVERSCPTCHGTGRIIKDPCGKCQGLGVEKKSKVLDINIPKGIEDTTQIRLSNEGEAGLNGGPYGDLYVIVKVQGHKFFKREGTNIHCELPISMTTAALGGEIEVPTIDGKKARVKIPEGTQTGFQLRLRAKGMHGLRTQLRGDMYVHVFVETPVKLSDEQKDLLKQLNLSNAKVSPQSEGFFSKVKDFWDTFKT